VDLGFRDGLEDHRKQAAGTCEIALPYGVVGVAGEGGVEDLGDLRPPFQPSCNCARRLILMGHAQAHGAQAAQDQPSIFGRCAHAQKLVHVAQAVQPFLVVGDDCPTQHIRMAILIFGQSLHGQINAQFKGLHEHTCRPRVVNHGGNTRRTRAGGDGWNVLHFKGEGAWAFQHNEACVGADQVGNACPNPGVIILGHQHMIARFGGRQQHQSDGLQARGAQHRAQAA
jgi:hypothetical protein